MRQNKAMLLSCVTVGLPGGAGPMVGALAGDLQQETQEYAQHSQAHVGLCQPGHRQVSSATHATHAQQHTQLEHVMGFPASAAD